jgi:hypothetical protein
LGQLADRERDMVGVEPIRAWCSVWIEDAAAMTRTTKSAGSTISVSTGERAIGGRGGGHGGRGYPASRNIISVVTQFLVLVALAAWFSACGRGQEEPVDESAADGAFVNPVAAAVAAGVAVGDALAEGDTTAVVVQAALGVAGPALGGVGRAAATAVGAAARGIAPSSRALGQAIQGTGLQAHHLIEQRFAHLFGGAPRSGGLSVAVTQAEHQAFTKAWRDRIPCGPSGTGAATRESVLDAARDVYRNYPEILRGLGL